MKKRTRPRWDPKLSFEENLRREFRRTRSPIPPPSFLPPEGNVGARFAEQRRAAWRVHRELAEQDFRRMLRRKQGIPDPPLPPPKILPGEPRYHRIGPREPSFNKLVKLLRKLVPGSKVNLADRAWSRKRPSRARALAGR